MKDRDLQLTVAGLRWTLGLLDPTIVPFLGLPKILPLSLSSLCWHIAGVEGRQLHGLKDPSAVPADASVPTRLLPMGEQGAAWRECGPEISAPRFGSLWLPVRLICSFIYLIICSFFIYTCTPAPARHQPRCWG